MLTPSMGSIWTATFNGIRSSPRLGRPIAHKASPPGAPAPPDSTTNHTNMPAPGRTPEPPGPFVWFVVKMTAPAARAEVAALIPTLGQARLADADPALGQLGHRHVL